jgi:hypothetical protein
MNLNDDQQAVLRTIISYAGMNGDTPRQSTLAVLTGLSRNKVEYALSRLGRGGYLVRPFPGEWNYQVTPKGVEAMNQSPIVPPSPLHNDSTVVCRYEYWPNARRAEHHLIYTNGTCSCRHVKRCFHLRRAAVDLPDLIEQFEIEFEDNGSHWSQENIERMERWLSENYETIMSWSKVPVPTYDDF